MPFPSTVDTIVDGTTFLHASQVLGPQRVSVGPTMYNVKSDQYAGGAAGDGSTDDSAAIAAAATAAASSNGIVGFPAGTYIAQGLNLDSRVHWVGSGEDATVLKLKNSSNTFLVQSTGFAALTGTNSTSGVTNCSISNMSMDGNKANNGSATVPVLRLYGFGYRLTNLHIRNGNNVGLYSEWSTSLPSPGSDSMMAFLDNIKVHDCGSHGVQWKGPHDSMWGKGEIYNNGARGIFVDTGGDGLLATGVHSWGLSQTYAYYLGATGCVLSSGSVAEGATTAQIGVDANDCTIFAFVYGAGAAAPVGIVIGVTGSRVGTYIKSKINNCTTAAVNFLNDGISTVDAHVFQSSGTPLIGTINPLSRVDVLVNGVAGAKYQIPGPVRIASGNGVELANGANSSFATLSFDGTRVLDTWPLETASGQYLKTGGMLRRTVQAPAFAASYTPAVNLGSVIAMAALTGNVTVNAPTGGAAGDELLFIWLQDGTGTRTITYNAVYKTTGTGAVTAITTGASTRTVDKFVTDDGTNWRLVSRITGQ